MLLEKPKPLQYDSNAFSLQMPISDRLLWEYLSNEPLKDVSVIYAFHPRGNVLHAARILKLLGAEVILLLHQYSLRPEEGPLIREITKHMTVIIPKTETPEELASVSRQAVRLVKNRDKIVFLDHRGLGARTVHYEFGDIASKIRSIFITKSAKTVLSYINGICVPIIPFYESYFKKRENHSTAKSVISTCLECGIDFKTSKVGVIGYGDVGSLLGKAIKKETALAVVETDPVGHLAAIEDGFKVISLAEAIKTCDVILTVTGVDPCVPEGRLNRIIKPKHLSLLNVDRPLTIVNCGSHLETDKEALDELVSRGLAEVGPLEHRGRRVGLKYKIFNGVLIKLFADGFTVNLRLAEGNPISEMDKVQAALIEATCYVVRNWSNFHPGLNPFPHEIDTKVAQLVIEAAKANEA